MFLIFVTPHNGVFEGLRILDDHLAIIANWWRITFVSLFARYSLMCKSSIRFLYSEFQLLLVYLAEQAWFPGWKISGNIGEK